MQVDFYHLTRSPIERVLPQIAEKVLESAGRLLVVSSDEVARAKFDQTLWSYKPESFLPHGRAGGEEDARQAVLIAEGPEAANGARNIALVANDLQRIGQLCRRTGTFLCRGAPQPEPPPGETEGDQVAAADGVAER